jgi:predicted helicase
VITGNPPYSGISKNNGAWISNLINTYKYVDGQHFGERKHWLNDDYVKFIRFAQWKMEQVADGVFGIITNHSFLDNPTFRGWLIPLSQVGQYVV